MLSEFGSPTSGQELKVAVVEGDVRIVVLGPVSVE